MVTIKRAAGSLRLVFAISNSIALLAAVCVPARRERPSADRGGNRRGNITPLLGATTDQQSLNRYKMRVKNVVQCGPMPVQKHLDVPTMCTFSFADKVLFCCKILANLLCASWLFLLYGHKKQAGKKTYTLSSL
ncbi:hypothetical protein [Bittarella massiliensis (ex Durand et al. 2017)]|uniref:hypothetical protein n=1 Tax=Bittarella massiliensis (ex Durand et al. 2017) TaxID=1720313 RepID=UPI0018A83D71|nr:hypothetical protein [Bittarella massiliensis (ex Durand et al. 2017)]